MSKTAGNPSSRYLPIKELTTWTPRWVIRGRVVDKGPINSFKRTDGGTGKIGSVDIMDREGDSIRAKFWGDAADKWIQFLKQGEIYTFSGGRLQVANKRYNNLNHSYELTFDVDATIIPETSSDNTNESTIIQQIPYIRKYHFTTLREVHTSPKQLPFLVDLLVLVKWISPTTEHFTNKTTLDPGVRRLIHVVDQTGFLMMLTLFGEHTDLPLATSDNQLTPTILAMQNVQIREFRGRNGSTIRSTQITINPELPEVDKLSTWFHSEDYQHITFKSLSETTLSTNKITDNNETISLSDVLVAMQQLPSDSHSNSANDSSSELMIVSPVEPTKLLYTNRSGEIALCYPACHKCNRKMSSEDNGLYRCELCSIEKNDPIFRYMFGMHLVDFSGGRFTARAFHDPGRIIIGKDATELSCNLIKPGSPISELSSEGRELLEYETLWKKYRLGLRARRDIFGGEERTTVSIVFAEPLDLTVHGYKLLNDIKKLLPTASTLTTTRKRQGGAGISFSETTTSTSDNEEELNKKLKIDLLSSNDNEE